MVVDRGHAVNCELVDKIDALIAVVSEDASLAALLPLLMEARRAAESGPTFDTKDVARVADLIEAFAGHHDGDTAIDRLDQYAEGAGPSMFARAIAMELARREDSRGS